MSEVRGTFECPICGFDKPHPHEQQIVDWHRTGNRVSPKGSGIVDDDGNDVEFEWGPLNDAQRKGLREEARARWEREQIRAQFFADPVATIRKSPPEYTQREWLFSLQDLICEALARGAGNSVVVAPSPDMSGGPENYAHNRCAWKDSEGRQCWCVAGHSGVCVIQPPPGEVR